MCARLVHSTFVFRWLRMVGPRAFAKKSLVSPAFERPRYYSREYEHLGTLRCRVVLSIARSTRYPDIEPW
jgi:hypothetical protein